MKAFTWKAFQNGFLLLLKVAKFLLYQTISFSFQGKRKYENGGGAGLTRGGGLFEHIVPDPNLTVKKKRTEKLLELEEKSTFI